MFITVKFQTSALALYHTNLNYIEMHAILGPKKIFALAGIDRSFALIFSKVAISP